jgi:hypothetical protein
MLVHLPQIALFTIPNHNERNSVLASEEYPTEVSVEPATRTRRRRFTKLLQVRYGRVDAQRLNNIAGNVPNSQKDTIWRGITRWTANDQMRWIGGCRSGLPGRGGCLARLPGVAKFVQPQEEDS